MAPIATSLEAKLAKIRSPNLQNQQQVAVVLKAVEDILRDQNTEPTPTAYFCALLSLLQQSVSTSTILNKDLATSTVYLLDVFTPHTPAALLRSKFSPILTHLAPALTHPEAEAPLLRSSIGVLESLLVAQDGPAWALPAKEIGPRRAVAGLLGLGLDDRPKVRKRAAEALTRVLKSPPPSPSLDHPAADMCAATTLQSVAELAKASEAGRKKGGDCDARLIHALQLIKAVSAAGGWPSRHVEPLCEVLLGMSRSSNEFVTTAAFGVFEDVFAGLADETASAKLPRIIEAITELKPSRNDSALLPPWLAVLARGYEVYAVVSPDEAFAKLPGLFDTISLFLESSAHNVRSSAAQCLISLTFTCIPDRAILDITRSTETLLQRLTKASTDLLSVRYQGAWSEVFSILKALFGKLRWRASPLLNDAVKVIGDLRANEGFQGKKQADELLGAAVHAMGPDNVLALLPLNLAKPVPGQPGRAWMLPILRDSTQNTRLAHFRTEMVPLSEAFFQRVVDFGEEREKTVEIKIFETLVGQIWALLPGYCVLPLDLREAFDQSFAEMLANVLYAKVDLRSDICKALQNLVDSNKEILDIPLDADGEEDLVQQRRLTKADAKANIAHLALFSGNMLAVLFNVYSTTLPQFRGFILKCLNSFLSITPEAELVATFEKVTTALDEALAQLTAQTQADKQKAKAADKMPPMAHTLMDLVITITPYLPAASYSALFAIFNATVNKAADPQLQKKAYKVLPRLSESETGRAALEAKNEELQQLLIAAAETATPPARRDRLVALAQMVEVLPQGDLHFIPSVLSEVVISAKEVNEKARTAAFDLLVAMGHKMAAGGTVVNSKVPHMPADAPNATASLEEYLTMVSAGLAGSTPHMISASITALTRVLYEFKDQLPAALLTELVSTLDLFLTSKNREVVRSVLGFVKVCAISLPADMVLERLPSLVPNLMVWSHEHKAHFKAKVKHIVERLIRRFGVDTVAKFVPDEDQKLITNIRKSRERSKRKKAAAAGKDSDEESGEDEHAHGKGKRGFASSFEEAIYGSDESDDDNDASEDDEDAKHRRKSNKKDKGKTYVHEDGDEPLDLLDRKSLANLSSTRPSSKPHAAGLHFRKTKAKTNEDGKLVLGADSDEEQQQQHAAADVDMDAGVGGVDAYVEAVAGKDAYKKGQKGRIKFSNKRSRDADGDMEMDDDEEEPTEKKAASGKKPERRPLGGFKSKAPASGRVAKSAPAGHHARKGSVGGAGAGKGKARPARR